LPKKSAEIERHHAGELEGVEKGEGKRTQACDDRRLNAGLADHKDGSWYEKKRT